MRLFPIERLILVDFDGTLAPFSWPNPPGDPYPGVVEALRRLKSAGFYILIFTARAWPGWDLTHGPIFRAQQLAEAQGWLRLHGIPFDGITHEKQPALFTIDDRTLNPNIYPAAEGAGGTITIAAFWEIVVEHILHAAKGDYGKHRAEVPK